MDDIVGHVRAGFVRNRRNLLIASLAVLGLQRTGASITHLELFGNTIDLQGPLSILTPLWISWSYFLLRYYQYFRDLGDKGFKQAAIAHAYEVAAKEVKLRYSVSAPVDVLASFDNPSPPEYQFAAVTPHGTVAVRQWRFYVEGDVYVRDRARTASVNQHFTDYFDLPERIVRRCKGRGWLFVALHTTLITEYIVPFLVAGAPVALEILRLVR